MLKVNDVCDMQIFVNDVLTTVARVRLLRPKGSGFWFVRVCRWYVSEDSAERVAANSYLRMSPRDCVSFKRLALSLGGGLLAPDDV